MFVCLQRSHSIRVLYTVVQLLENYFCTTLRTIVLIIVGYKLSMI